MLDLPRTPERKSGLSEAEAQARLTAEGYNELPRPERRTPLKIVFEVLREPMLALLIAGGAVYLALGDWREALVLLVATTISIWSAISSPAKSTSRDALPHSPSGAPSRLECRLRVGVLRHALTNLPLL